MLEVHVNTETCRNGSLLRVWCGSQSVVCSLTGDHALVYTHLDNNNSSNTTTDQQLDSAYQPWLGLSLAVLSALLIGSSVILKKKALLRLAETGHTRAGEGGHGYLRDWLWWGGLLTMGAGEVCNFTAYMWAPATLVTPLGALSVLFSAILSSHLLGEGLNIVGKLGCLLCILGSVLLVLHAPQEQEVTSLQEMSTKLLEPGFVVLVVLLLLLLLFLVLFLAPRAGGSNVFVYVSICSVLGAFTVSAVKGLSIAIQTVFSDVSVLSNPLTWILLVTLIVSIVTQVNYLNKALDRFSTQLVYPVYYVLFSSVVLTSSIVLFQEWRSMSAVGVASTLGSFLVIVVGVAMLHLFKELQLTLKQLTNQLARPLEREGLEEEESAAGAEGGATGGGAGATGGAGAEGGGAWRVRRHPKEDKYGLMDNMVIESLPPMRDSGPRVFIIS